MGDGADGAFQEEFQNLQKGVCLIRSIMPCHKVNASRNEPELGTGFYWGNGLVMTASHCLDYDTQNSEFIFPGLGGANGITFGRHMRQCLRFRLWSEDSGDTHKRDKDMAWVKLGRQLQFSKKDQLEDWEKIEDGYLSEHSIPSFVHLIMPGWQLRGQDLVFGENDNVPDEEHANVPERQLVYGIHVTDNPPTINTHTSRMGNTALTQDGEAVHTFSIVPAGDGFFPRGASGCPIIACVKNKCKFIGIMFSGYVREDAVQNDAVQNDAVQEDAVQNDAVQDDKVLSWPSEIKAAVRNFVYIFDMYDRMEFWKRVAETIPVDLQQDALVQVDKCLNFVLKARRGLGHDLYIYWDVLGKRWKLIQNDQNPPELLEESYIVVYKEYEDDRKQIIYDLQPRLGQIHDQGGILRYYDKRPDGGYDESVRVAVNDDGVCVKPEDGWQRAGRLYVFASRVMARLQDMIKEKAPVTEIIAMVTEEVAVDELVVMMTWNAMMDAVEWNKTDELVANQALEHLKQYASLLSSLATSTHAKLNLLLQIQEYCYDNKNFDKVFRKIVVLLYKMEVISKDVIIEWYQTGHSAKGKTVFLDQIKSFVERLNISEEAEYDDEED